MYAEYFKQNEEEDVLLTSESFEIQGDETMELGNVVRQLYKMFDVVDYVHYTGDVRKPLNMFFSKHMQFSFRTKNYWVAIHFNY